MKNTLTLMLIVIIASTLFISCSKSETIDTAFLDEIAKLSLTEKERELQIDVQNHVQIVADKILSDVATKELHEDSTGLHIQTIAYSENHEQYYIGVIFEQDENTTIVRIVFDENTAIFVSRVIDVDYTLYEHLFERALIEKLK
jgi:hypothetical protein